METSMSMMNGARRVLETRTCALVLAILLAFDWLTLPNTRWARSQLAFGPPLRSTAHGRGLPVAIYRTPAGLRAVLADDDEPQAGWERLEVVLFKDLRRRTGVWAMTHESQELSLLQRGLSPPELAVLVPEVLRAIDQSAWRDQFEEDGTIALLRSPTLRVSRTLRGGYVHDAVSLSAALLLCVSLALNARRVRASVLTGRRLLRGCCTSCGYPLVGPGVACPECGRNRSGPVMRS
jgi:hypothetical protein